MTLQTKTLPLDEIRIDGGTQSRVKINTDRVALFVERMADGDEFPAVDVFFDGKDYWLADGFHRYHAALKRGKPGLTCTVRPGTVRDAILFSFHANGRHGLPFTLEDKRGNVTTMLKDPEWGDWSDREIARQCTCSHTMVAKMRTAMGKKDGERKFKHRNGKVATRKVETDKKPEQQEAAPVSQEVEAKIAALEDNIQTLVTENEKLTDKLAVINAPDPIQAEELIKELREENAQLRLEVKSLTISRDQFQAENAQLIKQVNMLTKKLKKLEPVA